MSTLDMRAFLQELFVRLDPETDVTPGSRVDSEFIQPLLRRLGSDPFSVDLRAFIYDRMAQEFPDVSTAEGDGVVDLLLKPLELLLDPVIREHQRIRRQLSLKDPATLTMEEAEALGANFFVPARELKYARGVVRLYFDAPRSETITPANVITSRLGLGFFPDGVQSTTAESMQLRQELSLYYFDVNVVAAEPGEQYNVEASELVRIVGINTVVQLTNKQRFRSGTPAEDAESYISRVRRSLTERSLVTQRGIMAQLSENFPDITRLNVVGFGDDGMMRDVLQGGSLGTCLAAGVAARTVHDGRAWSQTIRVQVDDAGIDFYTLIGPAGTPDRAHVLSVHGAFFGTPPLADLDVVCVISATQLEVATALPYGQSGLSWSLRRKEILVQGMPGGLPVVDGAPVAVSVPPDTVHIGGAYDVHLRSGALATDSIVISALTDELPVASGIDCDSDGLGEVTLNDVILAPYVGSTYDELSDLYKTLADTRARLLLQILEGPAAGTYPIRSATQPGVDGHPVLTMHAPYPAATTARRWRIIDALDQDLREPKTTRITASDLITLQGSDLVHTASSTDFTEYGVIVGDTLRILRGALSDDYQVVSISSDGKQLQLDRSLARTSSNLLFSVLRLSADNGVTLPLVRVTSVELLDAKKQPTGVKVPYMHPLRAVSTAFSNPAQGIKLDIPRAVVGIVSEPLNPGGAPQANLAGKVMQLEFSSFSFSITFVGPDPVSLTSIVDQLNTAAGAHAPVAVIIDTNRLGIIPVDGAARIVGSADGLVSALPALFGDVYYMDAGMVRNDNFTEHYLRNNIQPAYDRTYDVVELLDGTEQRADAVKYVTPYSGVTVAESPAGLIPRYSIISEHAYAPQVGVHAVMGARSLGTARLYFQDPTSLEVDGDTLFVATVDGAELSFVPDPSMEETLVPSPPNGVQPKDGTATGGTFTLLSLSQDFLLTGVLPGDFVDITYVPVVGSVALADPIPNLAGKELLLSTGTGADIRITFVNDSGGIAATDVTRAGALDQLNRKIGRTLFKLDVTNHLELEDTSYWIIRSTGNANALFGYSAVDDTDNESPHAGTYTVASCTATVLTLTTALPGVALYDRQQYQVYRRGIQRTTATQMAQQKGPVGLFYADVELVSKGTGNRYNLSADVELVPTGYISEGYELLTDDSNLSFSTEEALRIRFTPQFHEDGSNADPQSATTMYGQNVQVSYEYEPTVRGVHDFLFSEDARVVCANPLARYLTPYFVRVAIQYAGGPRTTDAERQLSTLIHAVFPQDSLEVSDLLHELSRRGANSITMPVTLYALVHGVDRRIRLVSSQDRINLGKIAAFIPDRIELTRTAG